MTETYLIKKLNATPSEKYKGRWDVKGDVNLRFNNLTKLPLQFGIVTGDFYCNDNQLETLEGCPIEVGGSFICFNNTNLDALEGAPQKVSGCFYCSHNRLETLEGLPAYIGGGLHFYLNPLEHLNGLMGVEIKGKIVIDNYTLIKALHNTDLNVLEYTLNNHKYLFETERIEKEKEFCMYLEQIIIKKRLENLIFN